MVDDQDRSEWVNVSSGAGLPGLSRTRHCRMFVVVVVPHGFLFFFSILVKRGRASRNCLFCVEWDVSHNSVNHAHTHTHNARTCMHTCTRTHTHTHMHIYLFFGRLDFAITWVSQDNIPY